LCPEQEHLRDITPSQAAAASTTPSPCLVARLRHRPWTTLCPLAIRTDRRCVTKSKWSGRQANKDSQRSHDTMEGDNGPGWSFESLTPFSSLGVPRQHSPPPSRSQGPSHDVSRRGSASHRNYYASAGQRARTPDDTAMRVRYSAAREPTLQSNDDSTAAGPVNVRPGAARHPSNHTLPAQNMEYGQVPRFEGDGYDMRRPVGWQTGAEGQGGAEGNQHPVEISDGEDDDPIAIAEEEGDYFEVYNNAVQPGRNGSEDVVDLTEDDDIILTNWLPHPRHLHNDNQARSQPAIQAAPRPTLLVYHEAWLASSTWTTAKNNGRSMTSPSFSSRRRQKFSLCLHGRSIHAIAPHPSLAVANPSATMCSLCRNDH
jgi:hypothetical protein